jgi:gamma-butyrobetaine dioxygenase
VAQRVDDPINVAYSNMALDVHIDLAYYESPPGLQLLHCMQFDADVIGGNSIVLDGFRVAEVRRMSVQYAALSL